MLIKFYECALADVRKKKEGWAAIVANGSMQSFEDYRFMCGRIKGLEEAEALLQDTFKNLTDHTVF